MIKVDIPYRTPPEVMEQLWKDGEYVRFFALRDAVRRYRDLKVYQYNGKTFLASVHVNVMAATTKVISFLNDYPVPEVAPAWLWVSYRDPKINQVIYSDSPQTEICCRNPSGFGVVPCPGWELDLLGKGFGKHVRDTVAAWFDKHPVIQYEQTDKK